MRKRDSDKQNTLQGIDDQQLRSSRLFHRMKSNRNVPVALYSIDSFHFNLDVAFSFFSVRQLKGEPKVLVAHRKIARSPLLETQKRSKLDL